MKLKTNTLLLVVLLFSSAISFSQVTLKNQLALGGNSADFFSKLFLTKDGGRIEIGSSLSSKSLDVTDTTRGGYDYWVLKLDSRERVQWNKLIGGSGDDIANDIIQTKDGGYLIGGTSSSGISGNKSEAQRGTGFDTDFWILKLDSTGKIQWDKTLGGNLEEEVTSVTQVSDGGYLVGGYSLSGKSGDKSDSSRGSYDYWIVKLNSSGIKVWDKTIGGNSSDQLSKIVANIDGTLLLAGTSSSDKSAEKSENSMHSSDYWIVKIDKNGNRLWDKTLGGGDQDVLYDAQATLDKGYVLGGSSSSNKSGDKSEGKKGFLDYWVIKIDSLAAKQWDKTIGGTGFCTLYSLQQTADKGYILGGGASSGSGHDKTDSSRGGSDFWVVKLATNGKVQWDKTIGGSDNDVPYSIKETKKNNYVCGGWSTSGISGDKTVASKGESDYWTVDFVYTKATAKITSSATNILKGDNNLTQTIKIFPNPTSQILYVNSLVTENIIISDSYGKIVKQLKINGNVKIDISNLKSGIYFLRNTTSSFSTKFIILR